MNLTDLCSCFTPDHLKVTVPSRPDGRVRILTKDIVDPDGRASKQTLSGRRYRSLMILADS